MAEALVSSLVEHLASITQEQAEQGVRLVLNVKKEAANLTRNLKAIQCLLQDAEERQVKEASVRHWLNNLKEVSYEMDDVLDDWSTEILKQEIQKQEKESDSVVTKKVCVSISSICLCFYFCNKVNQIILRRSIALKIKDLNERLTLISNERQSYNFHYTKRDVVDEHERLKSSSLLDKSGTFGRDTERGILVSKLLSQNSLEERGPLVISIVGMGGIGKTTLAQLAYNDQEVKAYFDQRIWVCVSDPFEQVMVAEAIIEGLDTKKPDSNQLEAYIECICNHIEGKKFLLVLDDVWDTNYRKWEPLMRSLQYGVKGSRILVTTRKEQVAAIFGATTQVMHLKELSEQSCWSLFCHIAFIDRERNEAQVFEGLGEKLVRKCQGLPLAAKTLACLMRYKKTIKEWEDVLNSEIWELEEVEQQVFQPLLLSYCDLTPTTKSCLLYCTVFPKAFAISRDRLIELWMSQGYLNVKGNKEKKIIGHKCFDNLVTRFFFHEFEEDGDGNIQYCKMHDIVHDFLQYLTKNECLVMEVPDDAEGMELPDDKIRHLTLLHSGPCLVSFRNCQHLRTLNFFDSELTTIQLELVSQLKCLRTLDLSSMNIIKVPKEIRRLIHLRYLDLSSNDNLQQLPNGICDLYNLQTLRVDGCSELTKLPKAIGKLINLRHLYIKGCSSLQSKGIGNLPSLQKLDEFRVKGSGADFKGSKLEDLQDLNQLEGSLSLKNLGDVEHASEAAKAQLVNKKHLLHLELELGGEYDGEVLNALQPHPDLESLLIKEYSDTTSTLSLSWLFISLRNLKRLRLSTGPNLKFLPPLGKLSSLESLQIDQMDNVKNVGVEFLGIEPETTCSGSLVSFPKLKQLTFVHMHEWKNWKGVVGWSEDDSRITIMPCLSSLGFFGCNNLNTLPDFLRKIPLRNLGIYDSLRHVCDNRGDPQWAKISQTPNIVIDKKTVQEGGVWFNEGRKTMAASMKCFYECGMNSWLKVMPSDTVDARSRRCLRTTAFKNLMDFVDRKEAEIKQMLKAKASDSAQD